MKVAVIVGDQTAETTDIMGSARYIVWALQQLHYTAEIYHWIPSKEDAPFCLTQILSCQVAFPLIAGLEGLLEAVGMPYVGSDSTVAGIAANKGIFNDLLVSWGCGKTPYYRLRADEALSSAEIGRLKFPLFVKPARLGASLGIQRVTKIEDVDGAIVRARRHDSEVLIEQGVNGTEVEVAAICGSEVMISEPGVVELPSNANWHDYEAKDVSEIKILEGISDFARLKAKIVARQLVSKLGVHGAIRFDFFVSPDDELLVGEVNCLPGHGLNSNFPRLFEQSGVDRREQMRLLIITAFDAAHERKTSKVKF